MRCERSGDSATNHDMILIVRSQPMCSIFLSLLLPLPLSLSPSHHPPYLPLPHTSFPPPPSSFPPSLSTGTVFLSPGSRASMGAFLRQPRARLTR